MSHHGHRAMFRLVGRLLLVTLASTSAVGAEPTAAPGPVRLDDVRVEASAEGTTVHVRTSGPPRYQTMLIERPTRLVVDLDGTAFAWRAGRVDVDQPPIRQVRGSQFKQGVARVVVELSRTTPYQITENERGLSIAFAEAAASAPAATPVAQAGPLAAKPARPAPPAASLAPLTRPEEPAAAVPTVMAQAPLTPAPPAAPVNGRLISLDFKDADVVNILRILAAESTKNIVISDDVKGRMSITLKQVPWEQALEIVLEARELEMVEKGNVIRILTRAQLARESEARARVEEARVKAEESKARAEAEIRTKAAEAALKEQEAEQRRILAEAAAREQAARGPLVEETIRLAYADPEDVARTLLGLLGMTEGTASVPPPPPPGSLPPGAVIPPAGPPFSALYAPPPAVGVVPVSQPAPELLARGITIRAHRPTNSIFIRHYQADVERIKRLVRETLDVRLPQIKIEARLNEISRTDLFEIGVQWGGAIAGRAGNNVLVSRGVQTPTPDAPSGSNFISPTPITGGNVNPEAGGALAGLLPTLASGALPALPLGGNIVNLPAAASVAGIGFGIIGTRFSLNLALQALESQAKTRSLSRPEIVTVENSRASIALGSEIPYSTVSSAGTQVQFKEAALRLDVTPTVIREGDITKIKMKVMIEDNSEGARLAVAGGEAVIINKRRAETEVVVREGEALVIGGIQQRQESETERKVPVLGDVPIFGWLFKARSRTISPDRELVVFITPTVLTDAPWGTGPTVPPLR